MATGDNNNRSARSYSKQYKELLTAVFEAKSYFGDFFGNTIETLDGISHKDVAFTVKTSDIPVVVATGTPKNSNGYKKGANVAMGTGTAGSSRFGNRTEVIYTDTDVEYTWDWTIHEGIDKHTVNEDFESAIADRLELHANAMINTFNTQHATFIAGAAGIAQKETATPTAANIATVFNGLNKEFVNAGAIGTKVAKVTPDIYAAIVDTGLMTTEKGGTVSEDRQEVNMFKGFQIEQVPESLFQGTDCIYAYVTAVGKAFTGIETTRTIESEDFDGVALQGAGKAGEYILPDNKKAVARVYVQA